jgi:hypothetical protein
MHRHMMLPNLSGQILDSPPNVVHPAANNEKNTPAPDASDIASKHINSSEPNPRFAAKS